MIQRRVGPVLYGGTAWHPGISTTDSRRFVPSYEMEWDDEGNAKHTGRYALLQGAHAEESQNPGFPELTFHEHERSLDHPEYAELLHRIQENPRAVLR